MRIEDQDVGTMAEARGGTHEYGRRRRLWALLGTLGAVVFAVVVVVSTRDAAVPVGASGMSGTSMAMGTGATVRLTMRDASGRPVSLPGGRPGLILFVQAQGCQPCVDAVQAAAAAIRSAGAPAGLTVISVDAGTSRGELAAFARSAGKPPARYVVDDRTGTLASTLGASSFDTAIVYDSRGRIVARASAVLDRLEGVIRTAAIRR